MSVTNTIEPHKREQRLAQLFEGAGNPGGFIAGYIDLMAKMVADLDPEAVEKAMDEIEKVALEGKTLFIAGNGGSAAVAGHWVNDMSANTVVEGHPGYRVMSLADNACSITAIGNDASFDEIFSIQLKANMRPGDVLLSLSVSGNSPNIVNAIEYANQNGGITIGCSGFKGGKVKELSQIAIHMPSSKDEYGPVEDMFSVIMHIIQCYLAMKRGRYLAH